jgi:uncharacterized membrane protein YczE
MDIPPCLGGGLLTRAALLVVGLATFAMGIVALYESRLGLSPWDVLHQGVARQTPLSFGVAAIVVSIVVLAAAWRLGAALGAGTVANAILVGAFVELLTSLSAIDDIANAPLGARAASLVVGLALMGFGTSLYLGAGLGAGPRDSLMVIGAARTGVRIGVVRGALEFSALVVGAALGGTVGVGTLLFAAGIGPSVEGSLWLLATSRRRRSSSGKPIARFMRCRSTSSRSTEPKRSCSEPDGRRPQAALASPLSRTSWRPPGQTSGGCTSSLRRPSR